MARHAVVQGMSSGVYAQAVLTAAATSTSDMKTNRDLAQMVKDIAPKTPPREVNGFHEDHEEHPSPLRTQDISIHNVNDYPDAG